MKKLTNFFIVFLFVVFAANIAEAKPRKKIRKEPQKIVRVINNGGTDLISKASQFLNMTARQIGLPPTLWCADFIGLLTNGGTRSRVALSYKNYGKPASPGCIGCIAVLTRRGGGHVGIVKSYDKNHNPILISGNHSNKVAIGTYNKNRIVAYRWPSNA